MTDPNTWSLESNTAFAPWLMAQRWFGDKSRSLVAIETEPITSFELDGDQAWLFSVTCRFEDRGASTYFVPLRRSAAGDAVDLVDEPGFIAWLSDGFREHRVLPATHLPNGRVCWEPLASDGDVEWTNQPGKVLSGEQSNTSIIYGDTAIVKLFRKLQPGINPDSEIVAFLTERTGYRQVPPFLGGIVLRFEDDSEPVELGAVQGFVANQGDCWRWLPSALASDEDLDALLAPIELLGIRTGELHVALGSVEDVDAFRPESYDQLAARNEGSRIRSEIERTMAMLHDKDALPAEEIDRLAAKLKRSVSGEGILEGLQRIRVHGDYHLGQVLRSDGDFVIIDFEGEPSRDMEQRRRKHSPLKDVAGMLRSLDYAVSSAIRESNPDREGSLEAWGRAAEIRFIDGYRDAVRQAERPLVPEDDDAFRRALDLFVIEKAVYEMRYELDNRPDWIAIPLGGLRRIVGRT